MVEAAALANRKNDLIASHSKGEEDVDETRLPEGVVPKFYGTMLAQLPNLIQSPVEQRATLANLAAINLKISKEGF
jgi:hypothetical protein